MKAFKENSGGGASTSEVGSIAAGSTLGLEQALLAGAGQPALTVLAVGFTDTGKVAVSSLGNGNVIQVYASGDDFNAGTVLYREFASEGEQIVFTGLSTGAIITSTQGCYGMSEQLNGSNESPMPLLSLGLGFKETFVYAFRDSQDDTNNRGFINVVNGPLASKVTLTRGNGDAVNADAGSGAPQTDIDVAPWGYLQLQTDGNTEFIVKSTNTIMACIHAEMRSSGAPLYYDSRLVMPLTNDGITWPRSGFVSAPYNDTVVQWYVRDGARWEGAGSTITTRANTTGDQTTLDGLVDNVNTYATITFTTPASAPSANNIEAIWESGGGGVGCSLAINENFGLSVRWGTSVGVGIANDGLTSAGALSASTQYTVVVEFDDSGSEVRLHYQAAADASFFSIGRTPEDTATGANLSDVSGTGDFSLAGSSTDVGGYSANPSSYAFTGTIDSIFELFSLDGTAMIVSPSSFVDFDGATGANDADYEPNGATRVLATGLISAYSGADSAGLEATPLMPTSAMSQVVAQPFFIADNGDGGNSGIAIASPYEGTAKVYEWNTATNSLDLAYTVPLTRTGVTVTSKEDQLHPAAGLISNDAQATNTLVGQLNAGIIKADVPITVVAQNGLPTLIPTVRSQNGTTTTAIVTDDDETLLLGWTPPTLKAEITEGADGVLYKRTLADDSVNAGQAIETWVEA